MGLRSSCRWTRSRAAPQRQPAAGLHPARPPPRASAGCRMWRRMNLAETAFLHPKTRLRLAGSPDRRGRAVWARDPRERARAVGGRSPPGRPAGPVPHPERPAHGRPSRDDWIELVTSPPLPRHPHAHPPASPPDPRRDPLVGPIQVDYLVELDSEDAVRDLKPDLVRSSGWTLAGSSSRARHDTGGVIADGDRNRLSRSR